MNKLLIENNIKTRLVNFINLFLVFPVELKTSIPLAKSFSLTKRKH